MNKPAQTLMLGIVGLVALDAAGPAIAVLIHELVPLVLVVGVVLAVLRLVYHYTSR